MAMYELKQLKGILLVFQFGKKLVESSVTLVIHMNLELDSFVCFFFGLFPARLA